MNAGLLYVEDGKIIISDDMDIALDSFQGIATVEVLNRVAAGEDIEEVIAEIQADIDKMIVASGGTDDGNETARGLYIPENTIYGLRVGGTRWINGLIRYQFITGDYTFDEESKKVARAAMNDWSTQTGGKIRFEPISRTLWDMICKGLLQTQYVVIQISNLKSGVTGESTIGSVGWSKIKISPNHKRVKATYLHELGHTIGLLHEHQRPDRDSYVTVSNPNDFQMSKIPSKTVVAGLKAVKIFFVTVYLPYIWYLDYGKTVGAFDFDSIMIYGGSKVKRKYAVNGSKEIVRKTVLSPTDIATVKRMY
jgi:hypothetical protein